jgi:hypothetical protein
MNKEDFINFILWQKMCSKENLWKSFNDFINEKVKKDKTKILDNWNKIEKLLDEINEKLEL